MSAGAHLIDGFFFDEAEISVIRQLALNLDHTKSNVHEAGKYGNIQWHKVDLDVEKYDFVKKIYSFLGAETNGLCVFYYLSPGAILHPHRDLTGASANARVRFHVPVITNENVFFYVSKKRVVMRPGQLWSLDTSYLHGVENRSEETRVHIVIECDINDRVRAHLPARSLKSLGHDVFYISFLSFQFAKALIINSWKDPKYFLAQIRMIGKFIGWRLLGKDKKDI